MLLSLLLSLEVLTAACTSSTSTRISASDGSLTARLPESQPAETKPTALKTRATFALAFA